VEGIPSLDGVPSFFCARNRWHTGGVTSLTAVLGDITRLPVDAIVNAADHRMRGGGGVDGAIHRAGGPRILEDCITRFPHGLEAGDAGWTTAGDLPAKNVIHTVGPNYSRGETDRELLVSCYRRALEVADELGARTVAFPLISAGVFGWPHRDAVAAAVDTLAESPTQVERVTIVAHDQKMYELVRARLARRVPFQLLSAVEELHRHGFEGVRVRPGMSPSGMYWRITISAGDRELHYSTGSTTEVLDQEVTLTTPISDIADHLAAYLEPAITRNPNNVSWFVGLHDIVRTHDAVPIAYADYFDDTQGWEIGWVAGSDTPSRPPDRPQTMVVTRGRSNSTMCRIVRPCLAASPSTFPDRLTQSRTPS